MADKDVTRQNDGRDYPRNAQRPPAGGEALHDFAPSGGQRTERPWRGPDGRLIRERANAAGPDTGSPRPSATKPARPGVVGVVAVLAVCVIAILAFVTIGNSRTDAANDEREDETSFSQPAVSDATIAEKIETAMDSTYNLVPADMLSIPGSNNVISIDLNGGVTTSEPAASPQLSSLKAVIANTEEYGDCGFVFLDVGTGKGLAYNADEVMYVASASKVPLAYYALMNGASGNEEDLFNIGEALTLSDNEAYLEFGYIYADEGYADWLAAHGVHHEDLSDLYPEMSARSLACFWAEILLFLRGDSYDAQWLASLLSATETSFIRDALPADTVVLNKGGWIAEDESQSVTDAGIVESEGHVYLMVIVTGQPDEVATEDDVTDIARALFFMRQSL